MGRENSDMQWFYQRAAKYCVASEKCSGDIERKLRDWEAPEEFFEEIILRLIAEKFIDDLRFAKAFVNDKYKFNRWGKTKIKHHLRQKLLPDNIINDALSYIDKDLYESILRDLLAEKQRQVKATSEYDLKVKLVRFAAGRGFESNLIFSILGSDLEL